MRASKLKREPYRFECREEWTKEKRSEYSLCVIVIKTNKFDFKCQVIVIQQKNSETDGRCSIRTKKKPNIYLHKINRRIYLLKKWRKTKKEKTMQVNNWNCDSARLHSSWRKPPSFFFFVRVEYIYLRWTSQFKWIYGVISECLRWKCFAIGRRFDYINVGNAKSC